MGRPTHLPAAALVGGCLALLGCEDENHPLSAMLLDGAEPTLAVITISRAAPDTTGSSDNLWLETYDLESRKRVAKVRLEEPRSMQRPVVRGPAGDRAFVVDEEDGLSIVDLKRGQVVFTSDALRARHAASLGGDFRPESNAGAYDEPRGAHRIQGQNGRMFLLHASGDLSPAPEATLSPSPCYSASLALTKASATREGANKPHGAAFCLGKEAPAPGLLQLGGVAFGTGPSNLVLVAFGPAGEERWSVPVHGLLPRGHIVAAEQRGSTIRAIAFADGEIAAISLDPASGKALEVRKMER